MFFNLWENNWNLDKDVLISTTIDNLIDVGSIYVASMLVGATVVALGVTAPVLATTAAVIVVSAVIGYGVHYGNEYIQKQIALNYY